MNSKPSASKEDTTPDPNLPANQERRALRLLMSALSASGSAQEWLKLTGHHAWPLNNLSTWVLRLREVSWRVRGQ